MVRIGTSNEKYINLVYMLDNLFQHCFQPILKEFFEMKEYKFRVIFLKLYNYYVYFEAAIDKNSKSTISVSV